MLDVICPSGTTDIQDASTVYGQVYKVAVGADGVPRAKLPPNLFRRLIGDIRHGGEWRQLNEDLIRSMAEATR